MVTLEILVSSGLSEAPVLLRGYTFSVCSLSLQIFLSFQWISQASPFLLAMEN